jgi:Spy/CpxP family protein refolding chaperone
MLQIPRARLVVRLPLRRVDRPQDHAAPAAGRSAAKYALAVALLMLSTAGAFAQQPPSPPFGQPMPQPFVWWKSEAFKRELKLSVEQINRIDRIWEAARPELRQEFEELSRLEDKFSRLLQSDADEAMLSRQIDRVETARANANKTRSLMLVQMRKVLTPEQRVSLDAIHARWLKEQNLTPRPPQAPPARDSQKKPEE